VQSIDRRCARWHACERDLAPASGREDGLYGGRPIGGALLATSQMKVVALSGGPMASLTLHLESSDPKEFGLGETITIGRQPDNSIVIDQPAVSSHHACVFREGGNFILEDLQSTNGTLVNNRRVSRCQLRDKDVVYVGSQKLVFSAAADARPAAADHAIDIESSSDTVVIDARSHQRLMAIVMNAEARAGDAAASAKIGVLKVVAGQADRPEYVLEGHTSLIGKGESTTIRVPGWFVPQVAVAVTRNHQGYVATRLGGKVSVNGETLNGRRDLKDGDVMVVGGLALEFRLKDSSSTPAQRESGAA
jgi:pSer/pThr/pTyr-binding forkhead associated (FHA) protein